MNHVYQVVWNETTQSMQAVSELGGFARKKSKSKKSSHLARPATLAVVAMLSSLVHAQLPTGGSVAVGSGSIAVNGNTMTITQATPKLVTNWQSFSVGVGKTVEFVQPSSSAVALNRVLGADVSTIQGSIRANGQVFLLNPNGVLFTPTAQVNVGGLVASTLNLSDQDFLAGKYSFEGTSPNAVVNQGQLRAAQGGAVALIAARIVNDAGASIQADGGQVLMGAGSKVTLDLGGPVRIRVDQAALNALIEQGGAVQADGGLVYMTAKSANALSGTVINHTGVTRAQTVSTGAKGEIYLMGGVDKDKIQVGGTLDASAPNGGNGGFIETSAAQVNIAEGINITTAATAGTTGQWLIDPVDFKVKSSGGNITGATLSGLLNSNSVTIQTAAGTDTATSLYTSTTGNGDIFIQDNITKSSGAATTLTLLADRNINVGTENSTITIQGSAGSPLNLLFAARSNNAASGHVTLIKSTIKTYGGDVTIGGGNDGNGNYATGNAIAQSKVEYGSGWNTDSGLAGVRMRQSIIDASSDAGASISNYTGWWLGQHSYVSSGSTSGSGGNVTIRGQGGATLESGQPNLGVWLYGGASITTAGNGNISINGTGGNGAQNYGRVGSTGVLIEGRSPLIAQNGDITIKGSAGTGYNAFGVAFTEGNGLIKTGKKILINTQDGTATANDNAILIRDGKMTFDYGGSSEFRAPLVGGTSNSSISSTYSFETKGSGVLTLYGDAQAWNANRPANTSEALTAGSYDAIAELMAASGLGQRQALYSFLPPETNSGLPPETNSGSFQYSIGTIGGASLTPSDSGQPLRLTATREEMIARGVAPRNATQAERDQAANKRKQLIYLGIAPVGATDEERSYAYYRKQLNEFAIRTGNNDLYGLPPEVQRLAKERRAALIEQGLAPKPFLYPTDAEKKLIAANRKKRDEAIARGETPKNATPEELSRVAASREKLVNEGVLLPGATPAERSAAMKARQEKINKGIVPPNANAAERVAAGAKQVGNAFRRLFGR